MEFCQVNVEGHAHSMTIYVMGFLADLAATRTEIAVGRLREGTQVLRVDLRGVEIIDPTSFVRVARSLSRWRDEKRGRVMIQFPERSTRGSRPAMPLLSRRPLLLQPLHVDIFEAVPERVALRC